MARNVIESFQKALEWRIQSWVDSLSSVLVIKEKEINCHTGNQQELLYSNEALLVGALREIKGKIQVLEASTSFKVMNKVSPFDDMGFGLKKQQMVEDRSGLEEGEYVYDVIHVLEMQCSLFISAPAGNIHIDLNVPGKIYGTFFNSEDTNVVGTLTNVAIQLNTEMLASMIEKGSRVAVRVSTETLLKGQQRFTNSSNVTEPKASAVNKTPHKPNITHKTTTTTLTQSPCQMRTPKRKASDANYVSGLVVVTPSRSTVSSFSSIEESSDSDGDIKPVARLQIPNSFSSVGNTCFPLQTSRISNSAIHNSSFATRLPSKKYLPHQKTSAVVTPLKMAAPQFIEREKGPSLPVLVEVACAAIQSRKKK
jgi:hypothetical protein